MAFTASFVLPHDGTNHKPFRNQPLVALHLLTILRRDFGDALDLSMVDLRGVKKESAQYYVPERDVYFYSVYTMNYSEVVHARDTIRSVYPDAVHIAGGPHINVFKEKAADGFDSIVLGEGEEVIGDVIRDAQAKALKPVYQGKPITHLDDYPYPSRSFLPKSAVVDVGLLDEPYGALLGTTVLFSRGCPFRCHFCSNMQFGPVKFRSPALIEEEIEYLKKTYGVQALALKDDNSIPVNRRVAVPFLEAIGRTNVKWRGQSRANGISEEVIQIAAQSGCTDIGIGVETVSEGALKAVNKKINIDEARTYIQNLQKHGIRARLHFIIGLPGEEEDIADKILKFVQSCEPKSALLSILCPVPGSKMFESPEQFGMKIKSEDWDRYRTAFGRFDEDELPELMFELSDSNLFGKGRTPERIVADYMSLQDTFRTMGLNF